MGLDGFVELIPTTTLHRTKRRADPTVFDAMLGLRQRLV
jgi:hypothetical protein